VNGLAAWGARTPIVKSGLFKKGQRVKIPAELTP
jgi:hypothetical protein